MYRLFWKAPMPDKKKDPFKPQAPSIPGVPAQATPAPSREPNKSLDAPSGPQGSPFAAVGIAAGVVGVFVIIGMLSFHSFVSGRTKPAPADTGVSVPREAVAASKPVESMLVGPGPVATTAELAKPWSAKRFLFRGHVEIDPQPAMVVKLPGGQYWAFSLQEPFGSCALDYMTDLDRLQTEYNFHASHPMIVNTCTKTVYDLSEYAAGSTDGALVRGAIVQGAGVRPPMAIEVQVEGKQVVAVRGE
jgi:hypothetical protein